jgi:ABC-type lipoprotein export system ATPase subunit
MPLLEIKDLVKSYPSPEGGMLKVLDVTDFSLEEGAMVAIHGESGGGKTTFLHLIAGILQPDSGSILFEGRELAGMPEFERDRLRATSIGYIFQTFNLLQGFTCLENVLLAMGFADGLDEGRAREMLVRVDLANRLDHFPRQLSIGQQQRVAVARALVNKPSLVLADEPTGNLDPVNKDLAVELIQGICKENGAGLLLVSHDPKVVSEFPSSVSWETMNNILAGKDEPA